MKKQKICPICNTVLKRGEAGFAFPRLPDAKKYSRFSGIVHVKCLRENPETENIRKELAEMLRHSPYPIVYEDKGIFIQNNERDKSLIIYDFENFAIFPILYSLMDDILNTCTPKQIDLDVNGFAKLSIDSNLAVSIFKPFSGETIKLSSFPLNRLKKMLSTLLAGQKAENLIAQIKQFVDTWQIKPKKEKRRIRSAFFLFSNHGGQIRNNRINFKNIPERMKLWSNNLNNRP